MIRVYGGVFSRAGMVMTALEALGLDYEVVDLAPRSAGTQTTEYRLLNPTGKVPTLEDGELVLWETQAILFYLAQKYGSGLLWAEAPEKVAEIYRWSLYVSNQLEGPALTLLLQVKYGQGDESSQAVARTELDRFLPTLEAHLAKHDFVACDKLTVADIHGALVLAWIKLAGFDLNAYPAVHGWIKRMLSHPAQQKVMARAKK